MKEVYEHDTLDYYIRNYNCNIYGIIYSYICKTKKVRKKGAQGTITE